MPNGKGTSEWGWIPGPEELVIALIVFLITIVITRHVFIALISALIGSLLMLWANNGWPGIRR